MGSFANIDAGVFDDSGKQFAVLIDEAHGSTSGETMKAVNAVLSDVEAPKSSAVQRLTPFGKKSII